MAKEEFKLGRLIRAWRKKRNLIQKELAYAVDMDVTQMWAIENDRNSPSIRTVCRIADALGLSVHELTAPPPGIDMPGAANSTPAAKKHFGTLSVNGSDFIPTLRRTGKHDALTQPLIAKLERQLEEVCKLESRFQSENPTSLPFGFPFAKSATGATQLANAIRSHCDIGSAIVRDIRSVLEIHGIRIIETDFPKGMESLGFYQPERRKFTIFLDHKLRSKPWRSDFLLLSEIGRCFIFVSCGHNTAAPRHVNERFARQFAAAFLLPETAIRSSVSSLRITPEEWTIELLLRMKERFGVSAEMLNIRLKELALISRRLHDSFAQIISGYYRKTGFGEPESDPALALNRIGDLQALEKGAKSKTRKTRPRHLPTQKREKTASSTSSS